MKRKAGVMIAVILICLMCSMPVWARAGGGGGGSGSGGSSGSVEVEGLSPVLRQMLQAARAAMLLAFLYRECFFWRLPAEGVLFSSGKEEKPKEEAVRL